MPVLLCASAPHDETTLNTPSFSSQQCQWMIVIFPLTQTTRGVIMSEYPLNSIPEAPLAYPPCRVGDGHNPKLSRQPMYGVEPCIFALDCSDGRDVPPAGEVRWMAILPGWNLEW